MLYLIKSAAYRKDSTDENETFETILKIGYAETKRRFFQYLTENPTFRILYVIPDGDKQDEKNLHNHFKEYLVYGREWYSKEKDILDYFATHKTKKSLEDLSDHHSTRQFSSIKKDIMETFEYIEKFKFLPLYIRGYKELDFVIEHDRLDKELDEKGISLEDQPSYIESLYPDIDFSICKSDKFSDDTAKLLKKFNKKPDFVDRMKYLYGLSKSKITLEFLLQLPYSVRNLYSYSIERCKALSYIESDIKRDWENRVNNHSLEDKLRDIIYSSFEVGKRYIKASIKEDLRKIYEDIGYRATPKAIDLEKYFQLKSLMVMNDSTGKRENGFEILKKLD